MRQYNHKTIESKWRKKWEKDALYHVDLKKAEKPYYNLMMFPYPSAEGLHVGNAYAFTGSDVHGRFKRLQGYDVFEPIGLDGFGIHSENYALKKNTHPSQMAKITEKAFYRQLHMLGNIYDWDHTVETYDPDYYKWTQWIFVQMFKAGLAERKTAPVDWCPSCKTVLADEQVIAGMCERCKTKIVQKELSQWFFTITKYAERLLKNLVTIDWTEKTKLAQRMWIGKKDGTVVKFPVAQKTQLYIEVFTTRLDTICGATFLVLAPEHPQAPTLSRDDCVEKVKRYIDQSKHLAEQDRLNAEKEKSGVFTGAYAKNPVTGEKIPIWVADYVLMGYGTGAIMGVPGHDQRDFTFAKKYDLPIRSVVVPRERQDPIHLEAYEGYGVLVNSGKYNGLTSEKAIQTITKDLKNKHLAREKITYHLRDWLISRQRYWGPPIPMIYCNTCGWQPVPEKDLPVLLPETENYRPKGTGKSPLASIPEFVNATCPECKGTAVRETDVSDTFLDSALYFLRYPSVDANEVTGPVGSSSLPWNPELTKRWLPVTMYIGGHEHAVLHLLYSRFLTMALHDMGYLHFEEPFTTFRAHGLLTRDGAKMSKSKGNVVVPDDYIKSHGTDSLRIFLMFSGPFSEGGNWMDRGLEGVYRFLGRVWRLAERIDETNEANGTNARKDTERQRALHQTIHRITKDLEQLRYNTAIAALMEYTNYLYRGDMGDTGNGGRVSKQEFETLLLLLAPFAPFITEELWEQLGNSYSIHNQPWPKANPQLLIEEITTVVIQVNGRVRDRLTLPAGLGEEALKDHALKSTRVQKFIAGKNVSQTIVIPDKIVNVVTQDERR